MAIGFAFLRYTEPHTALEVLSALLSQFAEAHDGVFSIIRSVYERILQPGRFYLNNRPWVT